MRSLEDPLSFCVIFWGHLSRKKRKEIDALLRNCTHDDLEITSSSSSDSSNDAHVSPDDDDEHDKELKKRRLEMACYSLGFCVDVAPSLSPLSTAGSRQAHLIDRYQGDASNSGEGNGGELTRLPQTPLGAPSETMTTTTTMIAAPACFNCGEAGHSFKECPKPVNQEKIREQRQLYMDSKPSSSAIGNKDSGRRYFEEDPMEKFKAFKPGIVSSQLRNALDILDTPLHYTSISQSLSHLCHHLRPSHHLLVSVVDLCILSLTIVDTYWIERRASLLHENATPWLSSRIHRTINNR
eukprot:TRINITY_DN2704_c1_g1_i1.p1 TRINITY_DN2704_c1_g1~~TRINITY_DN2704_c1_g1_i1.p1  ORF type:complete len:296 (+),score=58.83 TRINITY_DN2704_c1_g1_i1:411-1298(+)